MTNTSQPEGGLLESVASRSGVSLAIGTPVCVWNHFLGRWTGGFAVAGVHADGYGLRRLSDDHVFPHVFSMDEVMEERRRIQGSGGHWTHPDRRLADSGE